MLHQPQMFCMQGNCSTSPPDEDTLGLPPAAARLRPFLPGQCLILTDKNTFYVANQALWLHNVYVRVRLSTRELFDELVQVWYTDSQLWVTNSTFQGDGNGAQDCDVCGIHNSGAALYVEGTAPLSLPPLGSSSTQPVLPSFCFW